MDCLDFAHLKVHLRRYNSESNECEKQIKKVLYSLKYALGICLCILWLMNGR